MAFCGVAMVEKSRLAPNVARQADELEGDWQSSERSVRDALALLDANIEFRSLSIDDFLCVLGGLLVVGAMGLMLRVWRQGQERARRRNAAELYLSADGAERVRLHSALSEGLLICNTKGEVIGELRAGRVESPSKEGR